MRTSDFEPKDGQLRPYGRKIWRMVEGQHRISTNRLAREQADQEILERLVDDAKPPLPASANGLHYLLATPFRYGHAKASRFRRVNERPGIFYGSEHLGTSVAESAYWRLLFFSRSPGIRLPSSTSEHTAFTVPVRLRRLIDLTRPPFSAAERQWTDPQDYQACQSFASSARKLAAQAIRYVSARDPQRRANIALLDPTGFAAATPSIAATWHFRFEHGDLVAFAAFPSSEHYAFSFDQFGLTAP